MGRSQETFGKKEREKKRQKKKEEKLKRKEERKADSSGGSLDDMIAYVDEFGNIVDTPPDPAKKEEVDVESIQLGVPTRTEEEESPIKKGRVTFFNHGKGFGFIKEMHTKEDFFVHVNSLQEEVVENNMVEFETERGPKGMVAINVKKVK